MANGWPVRRNICLVIPKNKTPFLTFIGVSINKAQAEALADGFVDSVSNDIKDGLRPRKTLTGLFLLAGEFIEDTQKNLGLSNASGELSKSLKLNKPVKSAESVSVDVMMNFYGQYINQGVKGLKGGAGEYSFKTLFPSKKMVQALEKSILRAKKSSRNTSSRAKSKGDQKNRSISAISKAYGAAVNIKKYGIKATHFVDKAAVTTAAKVSSQLGKAFKIDIINSI